MFQLKCIKEVTKKIFSNCTIQLKNCNFEPFCIFINKKSSQIVPFNSKTANLNHFVSLQVLSYLWENIHYGPSMMLQGKVWKVPHLASMGAFHLKRPLKFKFTVFEGSFLVKYTHRRSTVYVNKLKSSSGFVVNPP